ncbi:MAG: PilW family protein [Dyella sp.]
MTNSLPRPGCQAGLTLIELMVAMLLGLLISAGIVSLFISTSSANRVQTQLATLQEEGRYAITRLSGDLRMANGFYCNNEGGEAGALSNGVLKLDKYLRAPKVYVPGATLSAALSDVTTVWGTGAYPAAPQAAYAMPAFFSMRGYDCTTSTCTPVDPKPNSTTMAKTANSRVPGTSVLTLRYLDPASGWAINGTTTSVTNNGSGGVASLTIGQGTGEPAVPTAANYGGLLMLADCNSAQIFAATMSGSTFTPDGTVNFTGTTINPPSNFAPKVFDFKNNFVTVTYYLKVVSDNNGHTTGALIRRVNGTDSELVRGIERLDFRYGVMDANGNTRYLTAAQVDGTTSCPATEPNPLSSVGCLWRSVQSVEVHVLMDGQVPLYTLTANDMAYVYWGDTGDTAAVASAPSDSSRKVMPSQQGFVDQMLRREFTALISVRNYNP